MTPLSKEHFDEWREREFQPHVEAEAVYERKVDRLDTQLSMWLKIVSVGLAMGGAVLSIFLWVLLEKNAQIQSIQSAILAISVEHKQVVVTLEQQGREIVRQGQQDQQIMNSLIELMKQQAMLHGRINGPTK